MTARVTPSPIASLPRPAPALAAALLILACSKADPPKPAPPVAPAPADATVDQPTPPADAAADLPAPPAPDAATDAPADLAAPPAPDAAADLPAPPAPDATVDPAFADRAREIASTYVGWGRVDDELRWAPYLCRIPLPGVARMSGSNDTATHGRKLYSVFARHHAAYPAGPQTDQVVVKQAWTSEPTDAGYDPAHARDPGDAGDHFYPYALHDGMVFRAGAPAGLYLMWKLDPRTPGTDAGWVYATFTATGALTAAGRIQSCMDCHIHAKHDRLFGLPTPTPR